VPPPQTLPTAGTKVGKNTIPPSSVGLYNARSPDVGKVVYQPCLLATRPWSVVVAVPVSVVTPVLFGSVTWLVPLAQVEQTTAALTFTRSFTWQSLSLPCVQVPLITLSFTPKKYWVSVLLLSAEEYKRPEPMTTQPLR